MTPISRLSADLHGYLAEVTECPTFEELHDIAHEVMRYRKVSINSKDVRYCVHRALLGFYSMPHIETDNTFTNDLHPTVVVDVLSASEYDWSLPRADDWDEQTSANHYSYNRWSA